VEVRLDEEEDAEVRLPKEEEGLEDEGVEPDREEAAVEEEEQRRGRKEGQRRWRMGVQGAEAMEDGRPRIAGLEGFVPCTGDEKHAVAVTDRSKESKDHRKEAVVEFVVLDGLGV